MAIVPGMIFPLVSKDRKERRVFRVATIGILRDGRVPVWAALLQPMDDDQRHVFCQLSWVHRIVAQDSAGNHRLVSYKKQQKDPRGLTMAAYKTAFKTQWIHPGAESYNPRLTHHLNKTIKEGELDIPTTALTLLDPRSDPVAPSRSSSPRLSTALATLRHASAPLPPSPTWSPFTAPAGVAIPDPIMPTPHQKHYAVTSLASMIDGPAMKFAAAAIVAEQETARLKVILQAQEAAAKAEEALRVDAAKKMEELRSQHEKNLAEERREQKMERQKRDESEQEMHKVLLHAALEPERRRVRKRKRRAPDSSSSDSSHEPESRSESSSTSNSSSSSDEDNRSDASDDASDDASVAQARAFKLFKEMMAKERARKAKKKSEKKSKKKSKRKKDKKAKKAKNK